MLWGFFFYFIKVFWFLSSGHALSPLPKQHWSNMSRSEIKAKGTWNTLQMLCFSSYCQMQREKEFAMISQVSFCYLCAEDEMLLPSLHQSSPEVRRELAAHVLHELMGPSFFLVFLIDVSNLIIFDFYL